MAIKMKLEDQEIDTSLVDIPLFSTAKEAIKDIHIEENTVVHIHLNEQSHEDES